MSLISGATVPSPPKSENVELANQSLRKLKMSLISMPPVLL